MENFDFNDAIKNVKTFSSPKNEQKLEFNNINKNDSTDFSFKKNLNSTYGEEKELNLNEINDKEKGQKSIYSKNDGNIFSSGNFGTKKNKIFINDENINISNFSIFKDSNHSKLSSIDNYSFSTFDNMDFSNSNKNIINNNKINTNDNISPFSMHLFINKENTKRKQINDVNIDLKNKSNKININSFNYFNDKSFLNQKINMNKKIKKDIDNKNKCKTSNSFNHLKMKNEKSSNKFIILNNSILQKEINSLNEKLEGMSLIPSNIIHIEEEYEKRKKKENINIHGFPNLNNYSSIRKAFSDITNKVDNYIQKKENKKYFKAKMPKNLEIHKRKINIIQFEELLKNENIKLYKIKKKKGGCICRQFKNKQ